MFDISLGELMVIGAVSLVVIGPEKLPKVARTVGMLIGRAQRFTANVKADLDREIAQGELAKLEAEMRSQGESIRNSIHQPFSEAKAALLEAAPNADHTVAALERAAPSPAVIATPMIALSPEEEERKHYAEANGLPYVPLAPAQPAPAAAPILAAAPPATHPPLMHPPVSDLANLVAPAPAAYVPPAPVDDRQLDLFAPAAPAHPTSNSARDRR